MRHMLKENVSILTFHCAINYGAILQVYALQNILNGYGENVYIFDYRPRSIILEYIPNFKKSTLCGFLYSNNWIKYILKIPFSMLQFYCLGNKDKLNNYKIFTQNYLHLLDFTENMSKYNQNIIILGSDQIWNPRLTNWDKTYFYSNYPKDNTKVISYAASIGNDSSTEEELDFLRENIKNVDCISVREETAQKVLSSICDKPITTVLDPTLLLKSTDTAWQQLISDNKYGRYVLLYQMSNDPNTLKICRHISKLLNLKIIEVLAYPFGRHNLNFHKHITTAGPAEFVTLFAHAEYVVTSSFHGTAFSLIFNKQFVTVAHPTAGSRQRDLLARIGLSDRVVSSIDNLPTSDIDYAIINERLEIERRKSLDFLERALGVKEE